MPHGKRILITGGAGYIGSVLVPRLLWGNAVTVYDTLWFGNHLPKDPNLLVVEGDIRDTGKLADLMSGHDILVHAACIANDPSVELDAEMTREINFDCFEPMVTAAKNAGIARFLYVSTSSVYGTSDAPEVTEDHPVVPITLYNTYKAQCEPLLFKHMSDDFVCTIVRPSTVCGYSPRQRLDLCVNILTNHAINNRKITVFGGEQMRPNIHIKDLVDAYELVLRAPAEKIQGEIFNIGSEFQSIGGLALLVKRVVQRFMPELAPIAIETIPSNDPRSYRINGDKFQRVLGYQNKRTIKDAIIDLIRAFENGLLPNSLNDVNYFNVERMKAMGVGTTPRSDPGYGTPAGAVIAA